MTKKKIFFEEKEHWGVLCFENLYPGFDTEQEAKRFAEKKGGLVVKLKDILVPKSAPKTKSDKSVKKGRKKIDSVK